MGKRCFDILDMPFLSKVNIVAGKEGIDNSIFWVIIAEAANDLEDLCNMLKPDDFLIIKGKFLSIKPDCLYLLLRHAAEKKISGILIYKSEYCTVVPQYAVDIANDNKIPIFFLEESTTTAIEIQYYMEHMIVQDENRNQVDKIIKDIYYGTLENEYLRIKRAEFMGYHLSVKHYGLSVALYKNHTNDRINFSDDIAKICSSIFRAVTSDEILYLVDENKMLFLLPGNIFKPAVVEQLCENILEQIKAYDKQINVLIGMGQEKENINDFKKSMIEAEEISRIMKIQNMSCCMRTYSQMQTYMFIYQTKDSKLSNELCYRLFHSILQYDEEHNSNLIEVLKIYLEENKNTVQTAKRLYIHRNTLLYQIKKIEELSGLDVNKPENTFQFQLGLFLLDLIRYEKREDMKI